MDPRHPELAVERMDQLINQFKSTLDKIRTNTVSSRIGQLEREGGLVVQEICLVAPRLHEAMIQTSRQRRKDLSRGIVEKPVEIASEGVLEVIRVAKQQAETVIVEPKPRKKKTSKKKKAEK